MNHTKLYRLLAVLAAIGLLAAACGGKKSSSTATTASGSTGKEPPATAGFDPVAKTIHLGIITPLTGPVAGIGKPLTAGHEMFFNKYINEEKGGIAGKYKVVLDEEDSQYNPTLAVTAYNKLKTNDVMFAQLLGTPSTKAVLPFLQSDNMVAAPASLDADWVHAKNLVAIGGPYQIQMINALDYYVNDLGGKSKNICSIIQDDAYGTAGQAGIDFGAKELGVTVKTTAKYKTGAGDFTAQLQQLKQAACDAVLLVGTTADSPKILGGAATLGFAPQWIGQSPTWAGAFATSALKDYLQKNFILASEGTEWGDQSVKGMKDLVDRVAKYAPSQTPDTYFAFGYLQAWAVTQILEKAVSLGDLSHQGIINAMEKVGTLTFDGLSGDYKYGPAEQRDPPRTSTIFKINPAKPVGLEKVKSFASDGAKKFSAFG